MHCEKVGSMLLQKIEILINPLQNDNVLDWSKLKELADNKITD